MQSLIVTLAVVGLLAACGGDSSDDDSSAQPSTTTSPQVSTTQGSDASTTTTTEPESPTTEGETTTTTTAETTTTTTPSAATLDLAEVPAFVADIVDAVAGTEDAYDLAAEFFGFGFEVTPPEGSTFYEGSVSLSAAEETARWSTSYSVIAPGGVVEDVDISLDDNGPGAAALAARYDPMMAELGFERTASTGSDPGDPGGPNSLNYVYEPPNDQQTINGVTGRLPNIKVWIEEDVTGASYRDGEDLQGGYSFDYDLVTTPGGGAPSPFVAAILQELPVPADAFLSTVRVRTNHRFADSFDIDRGSVYVTASFFWELAAGSFDSVVDFYSDPALLDGSASLSVGEPSFFDEGFYEPAELQEGFEGRYELAILLAQRYGADLTIHPADDSNNETLEFRIELNPNDELLEPQE